MIIQTRPPSVNTFFLLFSTSPCVSQIRPFFAFSLPAYHLSESPRRATRRAGSFASESPRTSGQPLTSAARIAQSIPTLKSPGVRIQFQRRTPEIHFPHFLFPWLFSSSTRFFKLNNFRHALFQSTLNKEMPLILKAEPPVCLAPKIGRAQHNPFPDSSAEGVVFSFTIPFFQSSQNRAHRRHAHFFALLRANNPNTASATHCTISASIVA